MAGDERGHAGREGERRRDAGRASRAAASRCRGTPARAASSRHRRRTGSAIASGVPAAATANRSRSDARSSSATARSRPASSVPDTTQVGCCSSKRVAATIPVPGPSVSHRAALRVEQLDLEPVALRAPGARTRRSPPVPPRAAGRRRRPARPPTRRPPRAACPFRRASRARRWPSRPRALEAVADRLALVGRVRRAVDPDREPLALRPVQERLRERADHRRHAHRRAPVAVVPPHAVARVRPRARRRPCRPRCRSRSRTSRAASPPAALRAQALDRVHEAAAVPVSTSA